MLTNTITPLLKPGELDGGIGQRWCGSNHVDLFLPDVGVGNKEYEKEKSEKELRQKRFEGTAPSRLGGDDGGKTVPWYVEKDWDNKQDTLFVKGRTVRGKLAMEAKERDEARKDRDDPLSFLLKPTIKTAAHNPPAPNLDEECVKDVPIRRFTDHNSVKQDRKLARAISSHRENKKKAKHKRKKHRKHKRSHSVDSKEEDVTAESTGLQRLRQRRLERERGARFQASLLTGEDHTALGGGQAFSSQFNPALARQNYFP